MMYPYLTLPDKTKITHTQLLGEGEDLYVEVHFERPNANGIHTARYRIPSNIWLSRDGFTDDEIAGFEKMCKENADLIIKSAELRVYCCEQQFF